MWLLCNPFRTGPYSSYLVIRCIRAEEQLQSYMHTVNQSQVTLDIREYINAYLFGRDDYENSSDERVTCLLAEFNRLVF